jgi:hypothetical protein
MCLERDVADRGKRREGRFILVVGPDGSGKSTRAGILLPVTSRNLRVGSALIGPLPRAGTTPRQTCPRRCSPFEAKV